MKRIKIFVPLVVSIFIINAVSAQTNYINHTLKAGETLSVLAKQYNTNVGDIMRLNGMHADTKLVYGSNLKIPSTKTAKKEITAAAPVVNQKTTSSSNTFIHTVAKGETLFSISKKYNVSTAQLKALNKLADNNVKVGSTLLISNASTHTVADERKQSVDAQQTANEINSSNPQASVNANDSVSEITQPANATQQAVENNNAAAVETNTIQQNSVNSDAVIAEQKNEVAENVSTPTLSGKNADGFFADMYQKKKKEKHISGVSKTFKTASGWSDNKYYILANNIDAGTIVKLNADNGKTVYAKVLWNMGDMKENNGVDFRISDATAAALNENDQQFNLSITY